MKIVFEGTSEEIQDCLLGLFGKALKESKTYADQAAASASKADIASRNAQMALADMKLLQ